jgi:hypothetical protein
MVYPGHGRSGSLDLLDAQRRYLEAYRAAVRELAGGAPFLTDDGKKELADRMARFAPGAGLGFLVGLGADAVARELSAAEPHADPTAAPEQAEGGAP